MKVLLTHTKTGKQFWLEPELVTQYNGIASFWHYQEFYWPPEYTSGKPFREIPIKDFRITFTGGRTG